MAFTAFPPSPDTYETTNQAIPALDISWIDGGVFYKDISANTTFTFSNDLDGQSIMVIINNTGGSQFTMTWPAGVKVDPEYTGQVEAGTETAFNFVKSNGSIYLAEVKELS